jgi:cell division protein FtsL
MFAAVAAVALVLLTVVYILPVMINSSTTDLEAATGRLQSKQTELVRAGADLSAQVAGLSTPQRVAEEATKLGLQPAASVHYLQINAGTAVAEGTATVANR